MNNFLLFLKGTLIGIANIIPGVSGGTFALVLGLYERLMNAIKAINSQTIKTTLGLVFSGFSAESKEKFKKEWKRIDGTMLTLLAMGGGVAILLSARAIDYLLKYHPALTLAFFVGLILPSLSVPYHMMTKKTPLMFLWAVPGVAITVGLAMATSGASDTTNPLMVFLSGAIAISAMILPGISGSFVLLVMGQYQNMVGVIKTVQTAPDMASITYLFFFGMGCVVGLVSFARLLSYLLKKAPSPTLAFLIGLILGSFWILWPFKDYTAAPKPVVAVAQAAPSGKKKEKLQIKVATAPNVIPTDFGTIWPCFLSFLGGLVAAMGVTALGSTDDLKMPTGDGGDGLKDKSDSPSSRIQFSPLESVSEKADPPAASPPAEASEAPTSEEQPPPEDKPAE